MIYRSPADRPRVDVYGERIDFEKVYRQMRRRKIGAAAVVLAVVASVVGLAKGAQVHTRRQLVNANADLMGCLDGVEGDVADAPARIRLRQLGELSIPPAIRHERGDWPGACAHQAFNLAKAAHDASLSEVELAADAMHHALEDGSQMNDVATPLLAVDRAMANAHLERKRNPPSSPLPKPIPKPLDASAVPGVFQELKVEDLSGAVDEASPSRGVRIQLNRHLCGMAEARKSLRCRSVFADQSILEDSDQQYEPHREDFLRTPFPAKDPSYLVLLFDEMLAVDTKERLVHAHIRPDYTIDRPQVIGPRDNYRPSPYACRSHDTFAALVERESPVFGAAFVFRDHDGGMTLPMSTTLEGGSLFCAPGGRAWMVDPSRETLGRFDIASCTPALGCIRTDVPREAIDRNEPELRPTRFIQAGIMDGKLLVVWAAGVRGGVRMRFAAPEKIAAARDVVLFDDIGPNNESSLENFKLFARDAFALVLVATKEGVLPIRIERDGSPAVAPVEMFWGRTDDKPSE